MANGVDPRLAADPPPYRIAEVYMFDTCTMKCGYCWLAESGQVTDFAQLEPFKDHAFIDRIATFFVSRTSKDVKWLVQFTGGEPLIAPNLDRLGRALTEAGNSIAFYTGLFVGRNHPGFRFLLETSFPQVDYVMASFHPEAEKDENQFFDKLRLLKDAGHKVFLKFVGHPDRLDRLDELSDRCRSLDICFFPSAMLSNNYPRGYQERERDLLRRHFSSLSQYVQLEGGMDTTDLVCHGGSRVIAVNLQTGDITPCITVHQPSIGNIFENRLELNRSPILCPEPGRDCVCEVHYQQNIVPLAADRADFERQLSGFTEARDFRPRLEEIRRAGGSFYSNQKTGMGNVADDRRLFYSIAEIKENYRRTKGLPRTVLHRKGLHELTGVIREIQPRGPRNCIEHGPPIRIITEPQRWTYAAEFPLAIPPENGGEIWIRIRVSVLKGEGSFGVLDRGGAKFQDRIFLPAGPEARTIFLQLVEPGSAESLIVENANPEEQPSEIVLDEIIALRAPASSL